MPGIPQDFILHYTMDNISGATLVDESANGYDGTITGATAVTGYIGDALRFNGTSDNVAGSAPLLASGEISLSLWMDFAPGAADTDVIFSAHHDSDYGFEPYVNGGTIWFRSSPDGTAWHDTDTGISAPSAAFEHVLFEISATIRTLYVSNVNVWSDANGGVNQPVNNAWCIAMRVYQGLNDQNFAGDIDQLRLYNRVLTSAERTVLSNEIGIDHGVAGTITESVDATDFYVRASQLDTGAFIADTVADVNNKYALDLATVTGYETYADEILLTALPKTGKRRVDSAAYSVDGYYLPDDVTTNDHIYKVTVAGTTAATEPTLDQAGGTTVDGTVTVQDMGVTPTPKTQIDYAGAY